MADGNRHRASIVRLRTRLGPATLPTFGQHIFTDTAKYGGNATRLIPDPRLPIPVPVAEGF